jgi:predicted PurR-regulated permease PerM
MTRTFGAAQIITGVATTTALLHFLASILIPFVIAFVLAVLVNALVAGCGDCPAYSLPCR